MAFWITLFLYVGAFLVTELLRPKPDIENARPAGLGDFNVPTAEEGRVVPLIWGTVKLSGPNVVWFGDVQSEAVTEKIRVSLFKSERITTGFKYSVGMQFGLCKGPLSSTNGHDGIRRVWVDDKEVVDGVGSPAVISPVDTGDITINKENFTGEDSSLIGSLEIVPGTTTQVVNSYLLANVTDGANALPAYRGTVYALWKGGEIGLSPSLSPWKFEITRIPDGLGLASQSPNASFITENGVPHANPMNVLYEILTNSEWGASVSSGLINTANFIEQGVKLRSENHGFSMILDNPKSIGQVVQEIERQVDGALILNEETEQYEFLLAREVTESPDTTPLVDQSNAKSVEFTRTSWEDTVNEVRVPYSDPSKAYSDSFAIAGDMANERIQSASTTSTARYPGLKQGSLANIIAWRELRALAYPLSKVTIRADRTFYSLKRTDPIDLTWPPLGIDNVRYRVSKIDLGDLSNGVVVIDAIEDIFQTEISTFGDPITSRWTPFSSNAVAVAEARLFELPDLFKTVSGTQVGVAAIAGNGIQIGYDVHMARDVGGSPANNTTDADFFFEVRSTAYTSAALLNGGIGSPETADILVDNGSLFDAVLAQGTQVLADLTSSDIRNLILIDDEWIHYQTAAVASPSSSGYLLSGVTRGMFGTTITTHSDNARVWFLTTSIARIPADNDVFLGTEQSIAVRLLSYSPTQVAELSTAPEETLILQHLNLSGGAGGSTGTATQLTINNELKTVSAEPASPADGDSYIIGASPTGDAWGNTSPERENWHAQFSSSIGWVFVEPFDGITVYDQVTERTWRYSTAAGDWEGESPSTRTVSTLPSPNVVEPTIADSNGTVVVSASGIVINIPNNATVPYRIGRKIRFVNNISAGSPDNVLITDTGGVSYVGTDPSGGSLAPGEILELEKSDTDVWLVLRNG